jgi:hypothetical protein
MEPRLALAEQNRRKQVCREGNRLSQLYTICRDILRGAAAAIQLAGPRKASFFYCSVKPLSTRDRVAMISLDSPVRVYSLATGNSSARTRCMMSATSRT